MAVRRIKKSWWIDFRYNHKRIRKRSPDNSLAGAKTYESVIRQKLARGESIEENKIISFEEFSWNWYNVYALNNNKPSEQRQKEYTLRVHLNPVFGKYPLNQIPVQLIEKYKAMKIQCGLRNKSINNHLAILAKCLRTAMEWEYIDKIPIIKKLKLPPYESEFLSEDECSLILQNAQGVWCEAILLALKTGLRLGELTGLDWNAVDLDNRRLTVVRSLVRNQIVSPKSNKIRHIPLTREVCEVLAKRKKKSGFVFTDIDGSYLKAERCRRNLHFICRRAGLRLVKWHTLRHTFASHLIQKGAHQIEVQRLLGHSDIQTTLRYAHLAPSSFEKAINLLESENFGQPVVNRLKISPQFNLKIPEKNRELFARVKQKQDKSPA